MPISLAATPVTTVILVHGAFGDGSSWNKVIANLRHKGFDVVTVQDPLTSLADDIVATRRAIREAKGPVVLVGHSWGSTVIAQTGADPKVKALIYIAAFAPDSGMGGNDLGKVVTVGPHSLRMPPPEDGRTDFAQDSPLYEAMVRSATQAPLALNEFDEKRIPAAWKDKPSWYVVAKNDDMTDPNGARAIASAMKAHVVEVSTSHVAMVAAPDKVTAVIQDAISTITTEQQASAP